MGLSTEAPPSVPPQAVPEGFHDLLAGFRARLDRALALWLERKRHEAAVDDSREMLELIDGVGQLATQGGKRLRPALVYYTYRAFGGTSDAEALPLALATELLHTYLLIHDDIMDHAEVRRGLPAAHVRFREAGSSTRSANERHCAPEPTLDLRDSARSRRRRAEATRPWRHPHR